MTLPIVFVLIVAGMIGGQPKTQIVNAFPTKSSCEAAAVDLAEQELNDGVQAFGIGCIEVKPVVKS